MFLFISFLCPWKMICFHKKTGAHTKTPFPGLPFLIHSVLCMTRGFKESWTSSFLKAETLYCFVRLLPLRTLPCLCLIHWRWLTSHLYVFCYTLEEFSICSMCNSSIVRLRGENNVQNGPFFMAALFHTNLVYRILHVLHVNNEQTLCSGRQRPKSNCIGI